MASKVIDGAQGHKNINSYKTGKPTGKNVSQLHKSLYTIPNTRDKSLYYFIMVTEPASKAEEKKERI